MTTQANGKQQETAIVIDSDRELSVNRNNPLARLAQDILGAEAHNYDLDDSQQFMDYAACISTPPERLADGKITEFNLVHYYCKRIEIADNKTGEVSERPLSIMQTDEGQFISSTSPGVFRTILTLGMRQNGNRKFDPPVRVRLNRVPSKYPTPTFLLSVVPQPGK